MRLKIYLQPSTIHLVDMVHRRVGDVTHTHIHTLSQLHIGMYSCVKGELHLRRRAAPVIWLVMVPIHCVVILSWLMFVVQSTLYLGKFIIGIIYIVILMIFTTNIGILCYAIIALIWLCAPITIRITDGTLTALHVHTFMCFCFVTLALLLQAIGALCHSHRQRCLKISKDGEEENMLKVGVFITAHTRTH
jgi:hypothetical protein